MEEDDLSDPNEDAESYRDPESIESFELTKGLTSLEMFNADPYLRMQAFNLTIVDQFIMGLEYETLRKYHAEDSPPFPELAFLSAQSQMWIFAAYELLRTWRERAKDIVKWCNTGGLALKLESLEKDLGYAHFGRKFLADHLRKVKSDPSIKDKILVSLRTTHILFAQIEHLRVSLAKHEVSHHAKRTPAYTPGYGRLNMWCGSLEYELSADSGVFGQISRRDIADAIRTFGDSNDAPSDKDIAEFDRMMNEMHRAPP